VERVQPTNPNQHKEGENTVFISKQKLKSLEDRISALEGGTKANTFYYGEVDLKTLAKIIDGHCGREKKRPPAATDGRAG
jgi:hypothetical protein